MGLGDIEDVKSLGDDGDAEGNSRIRRVEGMGGDGSDDDGEGMRVGYGRFCRYLNNMRRDRKLL